MKVGSYLINVSRGDLVEEKDLIKYLKTKVLKVLLQMYLIKNQLKKTRILKKMIIAYWALIIALISLKKLMK